MASQYSLNLKAVLDTTQVKQELQKLRTLQQQALGKGNQNTSNVQNGSNNLGNLNALNSTFGRLTNSINQLNTAITKLNVLTKTQSVQNTGVHATNAFANIAQLRGMNNISQSIRNTPRWFVHSPETRRWIETHKSTATQPAATQPAPLTVPTSQFTPEMKRMLGGMAFGQGLNAASTIFGASGNTTAANVVSGIGNIGSYALMGSAAGPIGAAIGGIIGGAQTIAEAMAKSAQIIQEGAEQHKKIGQQLQISSAGLEYDIALERKDKNYFQTRLNNEKKKAEIYTSNFEEFNKNLNGESIEDYTKKTSDLIRKYKVELNEETGTVEEMFGHTPSEIRKYGTDDLKKILNTIQERLFIAEQLKDTIPVLQESRNKIKLYENALNIINEPERAAEKERLEKERLEKEHAAEKERIENAKKQQELITIKNIDSSIGDERTQIRLFGEQQSNQELLKLGNADAVKAQRDQYKKQTDTARENYLYYLDKAEKATTAQEKQEAYDIAMKSKERWNFDKSQLDMLNTALPQLLVAPLQDALSKLTAPSMENVNSLAGQGLMINRADDAAREKAMEDYEREQTELQRQIKDILQQNETTPKKSIIL